MIGLVIILFLVFILPFSVKSIEENLEVFLFIMGVCAASVSGALGPELIDKALRDPLKITFAVLGAGLLFKWLKNPLELAVTRVSEAMPQRLFFALIVVVLGLLSSVITAIISSLVLVIIVTILRLERESSTRLVIITCFSIGLGASLTPIGEPLSTIIVNKLDEDFFYLVKLVGREVMLGIIMLGVTGALFIKPLQKSKKPSRQKSGESYGEIFIRTGKVYLFVMGLTLLGKGLDPLINTFLLGLDARLLYWLNMVSAVLDNATLAAAEISHSMDRETIRAILLGLIISGGMLIPGNIPNIISAGKLNITSTEWAKFGLPFGLIAMFVYFIAVFFIG